jgi:hypothetical protein
VVASLIGMVYDRNVRANTPLGKSNEAMRHDQRRQLGLVGFLLAACIVAAVPAAPFAFALEFACPKPGTVIAYASGNTITYHGADSKDSTICIREFNGRTGRFLFNYYVEREWYSGLDQAKLALQSFFSGQKNEVIYERAEVVRGQESAGVQRWTDKWQRIGQDTVVVGGRSIVTDRVRITTEGTNSNNTYLGIWDLWYDPISHASLRGRISVQRGYSHDRGYDATALTLP